MDPQEAEIAALNREVFLLRQENSYLRDQVGAPALCQLVSLTSILLSSRDEALTTASLPGQLCHVWQVVLLSMLWQAAHHTVLQSATAPQSLTRAAAELTRLHVLRGFQADCPLL